MNKPPFTYTASMVDLLSEITFLLGKVETKGIQIPGPILRKSNTIKTVQATLAIEGNTLTEGQITSIIEGKKVKGNPNEILEVQNAIKLYESLDEYTYTEPKDLLRAHSLLMKGLVENPGKFRSKNVGILKGEKVVHTAPQAKLVPKLIAEHFEWLSENKEVHPIILSCITHYEIEFIHPFMDGNGRIGRFWQALILNHVNPAFRYIPIESIIKSQQDLYYKSLESSDKAGESTPFIEFSLKTLKTGLEEFIDSFPDVNNTLERRFDLARSIFKTNLFSRKEYMKAMPEISTATASRDLTGWCERGDLKKEGSHNQTKYRFSNT